MRAASTPAPTAATRPTQSAPWMREKATSPAHPPMPPSATSNPSALPSAVVPEVTKGLYQPVRELTSVLFMPAAVTRITTSPGPGRGTGTSRLSSRSSPP